MEHTFPLQKVVEIFGRCANELVARPEPGDLATLLRRGDLGEEAAAWGNAAWSMVDAEDRRALFLVHAALSDESVMEATGPLPDDVAARAAAMVTRVGPRMRDPDAFTDKLRHEELARNLAAILDLPVAGEREGTTRYMLSSMQAVNQKLEKDKERFEQSLQNARSAIDSKHAPARPYGE